MAIDSALGRLGIKQGVCTSSTRPTNPFEGQVIYESDTNRTLVYDNAAWVVVADNQVLSIDTTNNRVGIGTTSPDRGLHVDSPTAAVSAKFTSQHASLGLVELADSSSTATSQIGTNGDDMVFRPIQAERMRIASNGNVGIGTTSPQTELHVKKGSGSGATFNVNHNIVVDSDGLGGMAVYTPNTGNGYFRFGDTDNVYSGGFHYDHSQDMLYTRTNGNDRITLNSSGHQRLLFQPSFVVGHDSGNIGSGNYVTWNRVYVNQGSHFNTSNGRFTCPVAGHYIFWWTALSAQTNDVYRLYLYVNGAQYGFGAGVQARMDTNATGTEYVQGFSQHTTYFAAGDYIQLYFASDGGTALYGLNDYLRFGGWLLH